MDISALCWPASRIGEATEALARRTGLSSRNAQVPLISTNLASADAEAITHWIEYVAQQLGIEAEPVDTTYAEVPTFLRHAAPALVRLPGEDADESYLALWRAGRRQVTVIAPDLSPHRLPLEAVRVALCRKVEEPLAEALDPLLADVEIPAQRLPALRAALLAEQLAATRLDVGWLLRLAPAVSVRRQIREGGILPPLLAVMGLTFLQQIMFIATWAILGRVVFTGRIEWVWLSAWALLLFSSVPLQALGRYAEFQVATRLGTLFKARLLYGMLQLQPEEVRHEGIGHFLGRVMDADAVEVLSASTGFAIVITSMQLLVSLTLFATVGGSWIHVLALCFFLFVTAVTAWIDWQARRAWYQTYRQMTNDTAERMIGHRTRLAQEDRSLWHVQEDQTLDGYLDQSQQLDGIQAWFSVLPRAWMIVGIGAIAYLWLGHVVAPVQVAILIGTTLLVFGALDGLISSFYAMVNLLNAWQQVRPLFEAATRQSLPPSVAPSALQPSATREPLAKPVLLAKELDFRYRAQGSRVLADCSLSITTRDRVLLEGPSGGGKSTLGAVLAGLRYPESGLLLLHGFDRSSLGSAAWRQHVVVAPQFHENHVFTGTFAFNLLLGRRWPPQPEDLQQAEAICQELGLGELLARMPSGLQQIVGESGWQLSHGERSRLYIARALLQNADLMILDESFAALDPENLALALRCVLQRAPALIVIAHP